MLSNDLILDHPFVLGDRVIPVIDYKDKYSDRIDKMFPERGRAYEVTGIVEERMILNGDEKTRVGLQLKEMPYYRYFNAKRFEAA